MIPIPYYNISYGAGFEGVLNWSNSITNYMMIPFYLGFIFLAIVMVLSKREDRQYPMAAIIAFAFLTVALSGMFFKLMTMVSEYVIYICIIGVAGAIAWGLWTSNNQ
jgi:hypothetical protein